MHKGTMINEADITNMSLRRKKKICNVSACTRVTHFEVVKAEQVFRIAHIFIWPLFNLMAVLKLFR